MTKILKSEQPIYIYISITISLLLDAENSRLDMPNLRLDGNKIKYDLAMEIP